MRRFEEYRDEAIKKLRALQRALDEYEREPDSTYVFYDYLDEIAESIRTLRHAINLADFYHAQKKYSKAIDILERALDNTFSDPELSIFY